MTPIVELGAELEHAYRAVEYDERAFPELARRLLEAHAPHGWFSLAELVRWMHEAPAVPRQPDSPFGEPAVLLYSGRRFYIEALFWLDGTTSVHQHGFSGAFQVLEGGSIHTRFDFRVERRINESLALGTLRAAAPELLRKGDTRVISSGDRLIHSLFHLERPSVTMVVRTYQDPAALPQNHYLRPGIALNSFHTDTRLPRLLDLLGVAFRARRADRLALATEVLERAELHSSILILERLSFAAREELEQLVDVVARRHPDAAAVVRAAVDELRRQSLIVARRQNVRAPEHRFLLALLLNVDRRDEILRLVAERVPERDPIDQIVAWVGEMSTDGPGESSDERGLDYGLGEVELRAFRLLLEERSIDEVLAALAEEYDTDGQEESLRALCRGLQNAALFRQLLRPAPAAVAAVAS